jgi:hypothetical protein
MAKAQHKIELAGRHQIPVLTISQSDVAVLASIFTKWLHAADPTRPRK